LSSGTGSKSSRSVLIVLGLLVLILVAGLGYTYYTLSGEVTAGNSSISTATSQLQSQISSLNSSYQSQIGSLNAQISSYQSQISSLNSQLTSYQSPFLFGLFTFTTSGYHGMFGGNWVYTISGPYANFGANTANSAKVTFLFYSGDNHTGNVLCQTTVILGNITGKSVNELPQTVCNSGTMTVYSSWTWKFATS